MHEGQLVWKWQIFRPNAKITNFTLLKVEKLSLLVNYQNHHQLKPKSTMCDQKTKGHEIELRHEKNLLFT